MAGAFGRAQVALLMLLAALLAAPFDLPEIGRLGTPLSVALVVLVVSLVVCLPEALARRWPATRVDWVLAAYVLVIAATGLSGVHRSETAKAAILVASRIGIFYTTVILVRRQPGARAAVVVPLIVGCALVEIAALAYHANVGLATRPKQYPVPAGWGGYPELDAIAVLQLGLLAGAALAADGWLARCAAGGFALVTMTEIVLLYSRTGWASALAIGTGALCVGGRTRVRALIVGAAFAAVLAGFVASVPTVRTLAGNLVGRVATGGPYIEMAAPSSRVAIWERTLRMIGDHPIAGVGLGNFRPIFESQYNPELNQDQRRGVHGHNLWLHRTAELGIPGGLLFAAVWIAFLWMGWRTARRHPSPMTVGVFLALVGATAINVTDNVQAMVAGPRIDTLIWMLFGVAASGAAE
jgi:O-antigen ligase